MRRPRWPLRRLAGPEKCPYGPASGAIAAVVSVAFLLPVATLVSGVSPAPAEEAAGAGTADVASAAPSVHTVLGPGVVSSPAGLALDAASNLFVADSGHCRVLVVPAKAGVRYGKRLRPGHVATVAGGSCTNAGGIGHPSGVAVDAQGDLFIAEATAQRVQELRPASGSAPVTVAGTGRAGFNGDGLGADTSELNQPTSVAVDGAGNLYIADTANCRVRVLPAATTTLFGQSMVPGRLYTVAGTGVCGTTGQGGLAAAAELWNPVAVTTDSSGDVLVADTGGQSVLLAASHAGSHLGTTIGADDIAVVVGGTGSYGPYLADGLSATGPTAELNDAKGLAIGPSGALFVTDGFMHAVRVVPASNETLFGRTMRAGDLYTAAGALPVTSPAGAGDGTRWVLTHLGTAAGIAVSASGTMYVADSTFDAVRAITGGGTGGGA